MICQQFILVEIVIFIQLCFPHMEVSTLEYKDLEDLDVSCFPADTCAGRVPVDSLKSRSCDCGPFCARHRTCCIDSPYKDVKLPQTLEECTWIESIRRRVFMISKCNALWNGPERTRELCEGDNASLGDPVLMLPVTNIVSSVSYANVFCAMCNKDQYVNFWYLKLTREEYCCAEDDTRVCAGTVPRALEYTNVTAEFGWGYWHEYITNRKKFIPLNVNIEIPHPMKAFVTECFNDSLSECDKDWADEETTKKCESYMAAIEVPLEDGAGGFLGNRTYRNVHCASCNYVKNLSKASCKLLEGRATQETYDSGNKVTVSFPYQLPSWKCLFHIADISHMDDAQDCRTVVCDPGYQIHGRKCIPRMVF